MTSTLDRSLGCILGGAMGDAVGAPVEFDRSPQIDDMLPWHGRPAGSWTDDTEMTIATAEAILAADETGTHGATVLWKSYQSWHRTHDPGRAPGVTCLSATTQIEPGTVATPLNDSKGCGGVMRVAPIGIAFSDRQHAFQLAVEAAAMTHGHPMGYIPAGFLAAWVSGLIDGEYLHDAYLMALSHTSRLFPDQGAELTVRLAEAWRLAALAVDDRAAIRVLGEGWTGDEALAIAAYCAIKYQHDSRRALLVAANHPGDSDSTAEICGQIVGASTGLPALPDVWCQRLEQRERLVSLAHALASFRTRQAATKTTKPVQW